MSGDRTPRDYVAGVVQALRDDAAFRALLVGDPAAIERALEGVSEAGIRQRMEIVPASEVVAMGESPREAIRRKKRSSMRIAIDVVKEGRAVACVSAGNTG